MILEETYTLSNGLTIPKLGLGTWFIANDEIYNVINDALRIGYHHFDTAAAYENEEGIGDAILGSGLNRSDFFITSKIKAECNTYSFAKLSIEYSLRNLRTDYIDLMLIHAPQPWEYFKTKKCYKENIAMWAALEDYYQSGKVKAIGLANFDIDEIENILKNCTIKPMVNQILCHIGNTPIELIRYCQEHDILVESYSPIGHGAILEDPKIKAMAKRYRVSVPQLCIKYCLQLGTLPLPKARSRGHLIENATLDFVISDADMEKLINFKKIKSYGEYDSFPCFDKNR